MWFGKYLFFVLFLSGLTLSQDKSIAEELKKDLKKRHFSLGFLIQGLADYQAERTFSGQNGFSVPNLRFIISGQVGDGFNYSTQFNFVAARPLLDARIGYRFNKNFALDFGQYKAPFSYEFLESDGRIDYVTRSQAATLLIPSRQIGLTLRSKLFQNYLNFDFGIFNGNGAGATSNDNDEFMFVGRLSSDIFYVEGKNRNLNIGVNAASSRDDMPTFAGDRVFYGGDFRLNYDRFLLSGEYNFFESEATNDNTRDDAAFYLSIGYMVTENLQLLAKYDSYNSITETPTIKNEINNNLYVFGANYALNEFAKIFCNYIVNADRTDFKHHQLLVVTQILF